MSESNGSTDDHASGHRDERADDGSSEHGEAAEWFAASALRMGLAIVGFVLLLFALGQAVGFDLLGLLAEALGTNVGQWLLVALFALLIIALAVRGFEMPSG